MPVPLRLSHISPRHEKFAQLVASGKHSRKEAYMMVYPKCAESTAETQGSVLFNRPEVKQRVHDIQNASAKRVAMTVEEWRSYHEDVMRTPVAEVDEHHPFCQEMTIERRGGKRRKAKQADTEDPDDETEEPLEVVKIKMVSKQHSSDTLGKHHGWLKPSEVNINAGDTLLQFFDSIRKPGIPKEPPPEPEGGEAPPVLPHPTPFAAQVSGKDSDASR